MKKTESIASVMHVAKFLNNIGDEISFECKLYIIKWLVAWGFKGLMLSEDQWFIVLDGFEQNVSALDMITAISVMQIDNV